MVTFCIRCGASLPPFAPVLIKDGKEIPYSHYICHACGKPAGTLDQPDSADDLGEGEIVIKNGKVEKKG